MTVEFEEGKGSQRSWHLILVRSPYKLCVSGFQTIFCVCQLSKVRAVMSLLCDPLRVQAQGER